MANKEETIDWSFLNKRPKSEKDRTFSNTELSDIDTINNIGTIVTSKMLSKLQRSLVKMSAPTVGGAYTPIAYASNKLWQELGMANPSLNSENFELKNDSIEEMNTVQDKAEDSEGSTNPGETQRFRDNTQMADSVDSIIGGTRQSGQATGIGTSKVINAPFQFNPNDDVRSDLYYPFLGRVFNEKIVSNYPIAYFEVGRIKYNTNLLTGTVGDNANDDGMASLIRGDNNVLKAGMNMAAGLVGTVLKTSWSLITFDFKGLLGLKKYAVFENDRRFGIGSLYSRYVDDILMQLASMMGLLSAGENLADPSQDILESIKAYEEKYSKPPEGTKVDGFDITKDKDNKTIDPNNFVLDIEDKKPDNYAGRLRQLRLKNILPFVTAESFDYIPFLIHKDVSANESINNSTQQNPLQATLNGVAAENEAAKLNNDQNGGAKNAWEQLKQASVSKIERLVAGIGRGDAGTVISGEGRIALPELWTESSFEKTVSMSFTFKAPYGNDLCVFENVYIPFILLFCMSMPRQIGSKTYTSPFIIKCSSPGFFNIPMGIITSMSISRGEDKNNWTAAGRPRSIKVDISVKDISPTMMMSMSRGISLPLFLANDGFQGYLNMLGGLSIRDQKDILANVGRWWNVTKDRIDALTAIPGSFVNLFSKEKVPGGIDRLLVGSGQIGATWGKIRQIFPSGVNDSSFGSM